MLRARCRSLHRIAEVGFARLKYRVLGSLLEPFGQIIFLSALRGYLELESVTIREVAVPEPKSIVSHLLTQQYEEIGRTIAERAPYHDAEARFDAESWRMVSEAGMWRVPVPRELGGLGGTWSDAAHALERLASTAGDLGFLVTVVGHIGALRVIVEDGTPQQQKKWLDPIMRGEIGITAMTEDTGGSDLSRMRLAATPEGDGWSLSGKKVHITNAPIASHGLVAGRIPRLGEKRDITLFFLDLDVPGVSIGAPESNLGIRTSPTASLSFDRVHLTEDNIIGNLGDGLKVLYRLISFERALYGVIASGLIRDMLGKSVERIEERHAFNRPLADYQYVQQQVTDMKMASVVCRLLTFAALDALAKGDPEASILCSTTKFQAGEQLLRAAEHLVQLHGHLGFMNNSLSRYLRDAVGMRIAGGTSDIQRVNIFNQMRQRMSATKRQVAAAE
jgi:alkylation response protein AidB-like acyl-CoA dehydrogenase